MIGLNIGIAGYGIVGKKRHACIENHKNVRIVGVCDRNKEVGKSLGKDIKFFKSYKNLGILVILLTLAQSFHHV